MKYKSQVDGTILIHAYYICKITAENTLKIT